MKVTFVTRSMSAGGAERVIAQLAKHMIQNKVESGIITLNDEAIAYELPNQVEIHAIGKKSDNQFQDKLLKYREVRRLVMALKPDIVLALPEEVGIYVIPALWGTHIPVIVSERNNPRLMPWKKVSKLCRKLFYPFATGFVFQTEQAKAFFPDYMLTVYGDGELRDEMKNMAASLLPKKSYDFPGNSPNQW